MKLTERQACLTGRQGKILDMIVREYVDTAEPVSSQSLEKKYDFDVCPATIRSEMQKLTDKGFLLQPHTSAGRIPSDKGYRIFVNNLLQKEDKEQRAGDCFAALGDPISWQENEIDDIFKFVQSFTRRLAEESGALALNYLAKEEILWKEGWEEVLNEPEFGERDNILNFTKLLKDFEGHIGQLEKESEPGVSIRIGKENSFPKAKDFTVISTHYRLPNGQEGIISLLGPKRMPYEQNINSLNSLIKLLEEL